MLMIMSFMAYATTLTSYKFMNNQRVTLDLELYFYPFYFICSIGMWISVIAIVVWFIKTINEIVRKIDGLLPEVNVRSAHGKMPEKQLETVMLDFYHRRFNVLVCTTIIETGIDIPTANTIIIDRADND